MSRHSRKKNQQRKKKPRKPGAASRSPGFMRQVPDEDLIATDADLQQLDILKHKYATFVSTRPPGKSKLRSLKAALDLGRLGNITEIDHWAMEEFFCHGVPGDDWHPIEEYLRFLGDRVSDETKKLLRRWQDAQIGCWQIDGVIADYLTLRPWIVEESRAEGEQIRTISLAIGGARQFATARGKVLLGYVSPWQPERDLHCFMGYGAAMDKDDVWTRAPLLGLRQPALMAEPVPWEATGESYRQHVETWKQRNWLDWLSSRLEFPFPAATRVGVEGKTAIVEVKGIVPMELETAHQLGIYFEVPVPGRALQLVGASLVEPLDVTSSNWLALAEYGEYREHVGPPPGMPPGASTIVLNRNGKVTWH